ncbi:unnamed protein product [Moneuplotes crassus]|uniref:Serine-threonine/tyrosine-protein kinase catalytic domain-containing protein n=1 Tax=Euplotes crassus TaxID=5936 RepID=A0AAD1Y9Y4_EUPCR|nr:unnamed protein product [Moneuplotes crassus]
MGAQPCCSRKKSTNKKHPSVTEFIINQSDPLSRSMTIKQRHENTKDKLNKLVGGGQDDTPQGQTSKEESYNNFIEAKDVIKSDSMQELISKSLNLTQRKANSPLLSQPFGKSKKQHKARGSYSYSKIKKDPTKKGQIDLDSVKRNSQTYHSLFKNNEGYKRSKTKNSRFSRKSARMHRLSNPFKPVSSKLLSSSSSSSETEVGGFHNVGEIANTVNYRTEKAVHLKNGKPIIIKYFKIAESLKLERLKFFQKLFSDFQTMSRCQFLVKVKDFRLDEESNKLIMIQEHCNKLMDLEYFLGNYQKQYLKKQDSNVTENSPYLEASKVKIITFQIMQALKTLAEVKRNHGKLCLSNIFISKKYKIKISDYCIHNDPLAISFNDGQVLDLFNLGVCILKMLGLATLEERFDFYRYDKKELRKHYKYVKDWKLRNFLDILLIKKNSDLELADLQPFLQITDDDLESVSRLSIGQSTDSNLSNSVKCDFTFKSDSENSNAAKVTESDKVDPNLQKFLTNTSESTSMNYKPAEIPGSLMPSGTELPPIDSHRRVYKPISAKDERSIHHGFDPNNGSHHEAEEEGLYSSDSESNKNHRGVLFNENDDLNILKNVNKRISRLNFPGVKIGRLSKDDFNNEYEKELYMLAKFYQKE